jgi:hypothetical protein
MADGKSRLKYQCVEVVATARGCQAARSLKGIRLLSTDAPRLPLATCDRPSDCKCIYRHFNDRRQGPRRDDENATIRAKHKGTEQRKRPGRRDRDYQ